MRSGSASQRREGICSQTLIEKTPEPAVRIDPAPCTLGVTYESLTLNESLVHTIGKAITVISINQNLFKNIHVTGAVNHGAVNMQKIITWAIYSVINCEKRAVSCFFCKMD